MQIRFKTLTCKFKSQLDGDVTLEPKIWIKIPGRVIQGLEVHEATSSRRGWWGLLGNWLWSQCVCLLNWLVDSQGCSLRSIDIRNPRFFFKERFLNHNAVLSIGVINDRVHYQSESPVRLIRLFHLFTTYSYSLILRTVIQAALQDLNFKIYRVHR